MKHRNAVDLVAGCFGAPPVTEPPADLDRRARVLWLLALVQDSGVEWVSPEAVAEAAPAKFCLDPVEAAESLASFPTRDLTRDLSGAGPLRVMATGDRTGPRYRIPVG